ncbi:MFS transporter [Saccharopolyspora sp. 6V]|uniref:MFS transporter n=1 Tax=Saccharopolyspora sp. 6V TaxID=2877239 RepID=UPI001CD2ABD3|nr:MFS transporter [Saccharopolyspora sp. 6V]MCA1190659.1 MFS transporter [Saccharopolyspora sp. 6V]
MDIEVERPTAPVSGVKAFFVAGLGTALEYYDFLIYGLAAGLVFNHVFFPAQDPLLGTLYAFAAFGTGFFARPLGGVVIGHFGDRVGRRKMLVLTLVTMGLATLGVGLLPTYEQVGPLAPALLVALRLVQGFAAGGEWGGAALFGMENAPANRRGLWGSFTSTGIGLGTLLGTGVFALVSIGFDGDLTGFAWRIPFLLVGTLLLIGLIARLGMPAEGGDDEPAEVPLVEAVRHRPRAVLLGLGVSYGYNTIAYIGFTFFLSYLTGLGYGATESLLGQLAYSAVLFGSAPAFALLSDRIGRRPTMVLGGVSTSLFLFAYFPMVGALDVVLAVVAFAVTGLLTGITQGPIRAFLGEQFPARMRYSGMSVSYQLGAALGGGTASFIATGLLVLTGHDPMSVAVYGSFAMLVLVACSLGLDETAFRTAERIDEG